MRRSTSSYQCLTFDSVTLIHITVTENRWSWDVSLLDHEFIKWLLLWKTGHKNVGSNLEGCRIYLKSLDKVGSAGQGAFNKKHSFSSATGESSLTGELLNPTTQLFPRSCRTLKTNNTHTGTRRCGLVNKNMCQLTSLDEWVLEKHTQTQWGSSTVENTVQKQKKQSSQRSATVVLGLR